MSFNEWALEAGRRFVWRESERKKLWQRMSELGMSVLDAESQDRVQARERSIGVSGDHFALQRLGGYSSALPLNYLERGLKVAKSVGRVHLRDSYNQHRGFVTGFMVSPTLLLTSHQFLPDIRWARRSRIEFGFEDDIDGYPRTPELFELDPDAYFATDAKLDISVVAVKPFSHQGRTLGYFGCNDIAEQSGTGLVSEFLSQVHHPDGLPKQVSVREAQILDVFEDYIHLSIPRGPISIGAPLFNDNWDLVGMIHIGIPNLNPQGQLLDEAGSLIEGASEESVGWVGVEAVLVSSVAAFIRDSKREEGTNRLLRDVMSMPLKPDLTRELDGDPLEPEPEHDDTELIEDITAKLLAEIQEEESLTQEEKDTSEEEAVQQAESGDDSAESEPHEVVEADLASYEGRGGYDIEFLGEEFEVYPPLLDTAHKRVVLADGSYELKYHHFSLVLSEEAKAPFYVAANIHGKKLKSLDLTTSKLLVDPRIALSSQAAAEKMVSLLDPHSVAWGNLATKSFEDAFHLTNQVVPCGNESSWTALQNRVTEVAKELRARMSLFTGCVFIEPTESCRWMVLATVDDEALTASAYLLRPSETGICQTFQTTVRHIESLTGLDFGRLRRADERYGQSDSDLTLVDGSSLQEVGPG